MPVLSKRIVLDCFYLLIFYSEKFSTDVCRLPYAVNVNLNLSIEVHRLHPDDLKKLITCQIVLVYDHDTLLTFFYFHTLIVGLTFISGTLYGLSLPHMIEKLFFHA